MLTRETQTSTPFVSWAWFRGWCEATPYDWLVLAARPNTGSPYVAFMVLGIQSLEKGNGQNLYMGGNPFSCHTGFVCLPEYVETAIPSFATFIQKKLNMIKVMIPAETKVKKRSTVLPIKLGRKYISSLMKKT